MKSLLKQRREKLEKQQEEQKKNSDTKTINVSDYVSSVVDIYNSYQIYGSAIIDFRLVKDYKLKHLKDSKSIHILYDNEKNEIRNKTFLSSELLNLSLRGRNVYCIGLNRFKNNNQLLQFIISTLNMKKPDRIYVILDPFDTIESKFPFLFEHEKNEKEENKEKKENENELSFYSPYFETHRCYPSCILDDKLYLGDMMSSQNKTVLRTLGITHIINCSEGLEFDELYSIIEKTVDMKEIKDLDKNKFVGYGFRIPVNDLWGVKIDPYFESSYLFIEKALSENNNKVLIHCAAGVSRSATIVISYLMKKNKWGYEKSFNFVQNRRPKIHPNPGFKEQLEKYESTINLS